MPDNQDCMRRATPSRCWGAVPGRSRINLGPPRRQNTSRLHGVATDLSCVRPSNLGLKALQHCNML